MSAEIRWGARSNTHKKSVLRSQDNFYISSKTEIKLNVTNHTNEVSISNFCPGLYLRLGLRAERVPALPGSLLARWALLPDREVTETPCSDSSLFVLVSECSSSTTTPSLRARGSLLVVVRVFRFPSRPTLLDATGLATRRCLETRRSSSSSSLESFSDSSGFSPSAKGSKSRSPQSGSLVLAVLTVESPRAWCAASPPLSACRKLR